MGSLVSMREAAGQSIKSSLFHTYMVDSRDDRIATRRGFYTKVLQEMAGFGGDAAFYKAEGEAQLSRPVGSGVVSHFFEDLNTFI